MGALLAILGTIAKPLIEWFQTDGKVLLEKLLIYRKGEADQRRKDEIVRLEREANETSRAAQRIEEKRREDMERDAQGDRPGTGTIRVQHPPDDLKW